MRTRLKGVKSDRLYVSPIAARLPQISTHKHAASVAINNPTTSISQRPVVPVAVPPATVTTETVRAPAINAPPAGIMAIHKLAAFAIVLVPLIVLTAPVSAIPISIVTEGCSRHREHEQ